MVTVWWESKFVILGQVLREWMHFLENAESSDAGVAASINTTELETAPNCPHNRHTSLIWRNLLDVALVLDRVYFQGTFMLT